MRLRFTKMHGAGNDFVVLDATREPVTLSPAQVRRLADRRYGVGADQVLIVEQATRPDVDFGYRIFNSSGEEVEHCGNGARCFLQFVRERGLTSQTSVRVQTMNNTLVLTQQADGGVTVDMNRPIFDLARVPFDAAGLVAREQSAFELWPLLLPDAAAVSAAVGAVGAVGDVVEVAVLSMGNPHAVQRVADVDAAPVAVQGPLIATHPRFAQGVNAGFVQVLGRSRVRLRVYERGAGETLACGTGACAAVVAGIRLGWLDAVVDVEMRGGSLRIEWTGDPAAPVLMTGPAETVFEGDIEL